LATADTDVVISGTKAVTLEVASTAKSINATGLSAALTAKAAVGKVVNITGGSGDDVITVTTEEAATINGGAGTDTLVLAADNTKVVFSNMEVLKGVNGTTKVLGSQVSGKTYVVKGHTGTDDILDIGTVAKSFDTATLDLSGLSFDAALAQVNVTVDGTDQDISDALSLATAFTVTGSSVIDKIDLSGTSGTNIISGGAGADTIKGGTGAESISGGAGADSIISGTGADTIVGGEDADVITSGAGNDVIDLTEVTAAIDTVVFAAAADNGVDTVTGFAVANDLISVKALGNTVTAETAIAANAATTDLATKAVGVFANGADGTGDLAITDYTNMTQVVAFLAGSLTEAATETYVAVINDLLTNKAYVYDIIVNTVTTAADTIEVGDVTLVGTITANGALTVANTDFA